MNRMLAERCLLEPEVLRREIERFMELARRRSEWDEDRRRRGRRRYCRSWPLLICVGENGIECAEFCVALHNASELGLAFRTNRELETGTQIAIRLFWHDDAAPLVPAVVRHCSSIRGGMLIGCEFILGL